MFTKWYTVLYFHWPTRLDLLYWQLNIPLKENTEPCIWMRHLILSNLKELNSFCIILAFAFYPIKGFLLAIYQECKMLLRFWAEHQSVPWPGDWHSSLFIQVSYDVETDPRHPVELCAQGSAPSELYLVDCRCDRCLREAVERKLCLGSGLQSMAFWLCCLITLGQGRHIMEEGHGGRKLFTSERPESWVTGNSQPQGTPFKDAIPARHVL